jgi:hypothetical protein
VTGATHVLHERIRVTQGHAARRTQRHIWLLPAREARKRTEQRVLRFCGCSLFFLVAVVVSFPPLFFARHPRGLHVLVLAVLSSYRRFILLLLLVVLLLLYLLPGCAFDAPEEQGAPNANRGCGPPRQVRLGQTCCCRGCCRCRGTGGGRGGGVGGGSCGRGRGGSGVDGQGRATFAAEQELQNICGGCVVVVVVITETVILLPVFLV